MRSPDHRNLRMITPIALAVLGVAILIGCIPVPVPERVLSGRDFRKAVSGMERAGGLLVWASRRQVESVLGKPNLQTNKGRTVGYLLHTRHGYYVWPLCFTAVPNEEWYLLTIRYDESGNALTWDVKTRKSMILNYEHGYMAMAGEFRPPGATQPTTAPATRLLVR
jgi:hypothetical protein